MASPSHNELRSDKAVNLIRLLTHTKGEWAKKPFQLQPWQEQVVRDIFKVDENGDRIVREVFMELPRKNGKTELAAAIGLICLGFDGEPGAEVYLAAGDKDQASLLFSAIVEMIRNSPTLSKRFKIIDSQRRVILVGTNSILCAIPADEAGAHGFNPSVVICDELHVWKGRALWDALSTGSGTRRNPLKISITTAGHDRKSICWERYQYACQVRDGLIKAPNFLPVIFEAPPGTTFAQLVADESLWERANPALRGDGFRSRRDIREQMAEAVHLPAKQNSLLQLYFNIWTEQENRWLDMTVWDSCKGDGEAEISEEVFLGLDLANTTDLAAIAMIFRRESQWVLRVEYFAPEENARRRQERDGAPYLDWSREGWLTLTPGNVIDYRIIRARLKAISERFVVRGIGFDPWNATQLVTQLQDEDGLPMIRVGQGMGQMAAPTREFERLIMERTFQHDGNPILRWNAANVCVDIDSAGNMKPSKKRSTEKIDGIVAAIMATAVATSIGSPQQAQGVVWL